MIVGSVDEDGVPFIAVSIAGQSWQAVIDTGFNGDLELPHALRTAVNPRPNGQMISILATGQEIIDELYRVDFPFDGETIQAEATFAPVEEILIGTHLLRTHRLEIHFVNRTVLLERVA